MDKKTAQLIEIFSSVQGEGPYVGFRQLFMRFAGCNLACSYCDTGFNAPPNIRIEQTPGQQDFELIPNHIDGDAIFYYLTKLDNPRNSHHSLSLTGGEPLNQVEFLKEFLTENYAKYKFKIYLETNGTLFKELSQIVKLVDIVSMDIKIPSAAKNKTEHWQEHKKFLEVLEVNKKCKLEYFVKIVLNNDFSDYEIYNVIWCLSSEVFTPVLILQPETNNPPDGQKLLMWQEKLLKQLPDVRIIPQVHKICRVM